MKGRILVIRGGAIGDFILTLPVFTALRKAFPETAIDVMGYPHIASLARLTGSINDIHAIESRALAGYFARGGALDPTLADYFQQCSVIFSYLFDPDLIFTTNLARVSQAQIIQGPHRPDEAGRRTDTSRDDPARALRRGDCRPAQRKRAGATRTPAAQAPARSTSAQ